MNKMMMLAAVAAATGLCAVQARAEPWVDWTPQKGVWEITEVHVAPGKLDDYLKGLKQTWVPGQEVAKKQGTIDDYSVMIRVGGNTEGANVVTARHLTSMAALDPDRAKDTEGRKQVEAITPKATSDQLVGQYNTYRTFVGQVYWRPVAFPK
ncbi:MAG: hypothetical protein JF588_14810 [Caulobacterales bacterium]|nr:hypothetical protein [Caulobacterales bacterium]